MLSSRGQLQASKCLNCSPETGLGTGWNLVSYEKKKKKKKADSALVDCVLEGSMVQLL
jgi:hypothetical protein